MFALTAADRLLTLLFVVNSCDPLTASVLVAFVLPGARLVILFPPAFMPPVAVKIPTMVESPMM